MDDANHSEEGEQSNVGSKIGSVLVDAPFDGAGVEGTRGVGAKGDDTLGEFTRHGS